MLWSNLAFLCRHDLAADWSTYMATIEQFTEAIAQLNAATVAVAEEVARLRELITGAGLSAEQEAAVLTSLASIEANLRRIASTDV